MSLDLTGLLLVGGLSAALYLGWVAALLIQPWALVETLLVAFTGWLCQILGTILVLGLLGLLTPAALAVANLAVLLPLLALARRRLTRTRLAQVRASLGAAFRTLRHTPAALAVLALLAGWTLWIVFLGLVLPPYAFDELFYHMPIVGSIVQLRRVGPLVSTIPWIVAYPKNGELLSVWSSILLHRDSLADLAMLPLWLAGGLAVYGAGRRLGAPAAGSWLAGAVFWFAPTALIQAKTTYNDLMVGSLWALGLCFALPAVPGRTIPGRRASGLLVGLAAGAILGTKYLGAAYVPFLGLLLLPRLVGGTIRQAAQTVALFALGVLLTGGYWYASNLAAHGNPLWPFTIRVGGQVLFPGTLERETFEPNDSSLRVVGDLSWSGRLRYSWFDRQEYFSVDSRLAGLGPLWIILGVPSVVFWTALSAVRRRWLPLLLVLAHAALLALLPLNWLPRYSLYLLALGGCGVAALYGPLLPFARRWMAVLTIVLSLFALVNSVDHLFFTVERIRRLAPAADAQRTMTLYNPQLFGASYRWVEQSVAPGSVVAYGIEVVFPYPLWGSSFERRVVSVPFDDPSRWVDDLRAAGVQYAFVKADNEQSRLLASSPHARLAFAGDDGFEIYEVQ